METGSDDKPINPPGTDPRDITRVAPGLVEGVVVDLVKDRESRALKGTGRLSVAVHLLLLLTCLIMAGFTLSEVTFRVPSPIVGAAIRLRPSTWIMLSLAVLLDLLAGQWRRRHASKPRHVRCASTVSLLIFG